MKKINLVLGTRVVEEADSDINGKITVVQSLAWGYYLQAGDKPGTLTQSGGVLLDVAKSGLKEVKKKKPEVKSALILGLGGGSAAKLINKFWPEVKITGVEIDPVMVNMGMKYLGLNKIAVDIKTEDALDFCKEAVARKEKFDLVFVDIYVGDAVPEKFSTGSFVKSVKKLTSKGGIAIFNRLYFGEKRAEAMRFLAKLEKHFKSVESHFPAANVMFVCSN